MKNQFAMGLSKQAHAVYKLLLEKRELNAKSIGEELDIKSQQVYPLVEHLLRLSLIDQQDTYPVTYRAKQISEAGENYAMQARSWFHNLFSDLEFRAVTNELQDDKIFNISFVQGRDDLIRQNIPDLGKTKQNIKYIYSVLSIGVPNEYLYANLQAVKRGVDLKIIALEHTKENHNALLSYKHIGAVIRFAKSFDWHLVLYDENISYVMMYDPKDRSKQFGVRFVHRGINQHFQRIFDKYWQKAVPI